MNEIIENHDTEQARSALLYIHFYRRNPRWELDKPSVRLWDRVVNTFVKRSLPTIPITVQPFEIEEIVSLPQVSGYPVE